MNRKEVIRLINEIAKSDSTLTALEVFERFAALVAAHEREACAKLCEGNADDLSEGDWDSACINCADSIRARSEV